MSPVVAQLPTLSGPLDPSVVDEVFIAKEWASSFDAAVRSQDLDSSLPSIFTSSATPWWKDHLSLTWDLRTFDGLSRIMKLLQTTLVFRPVGNLILKDAVLVPVTETFAYIRATFSFETDIAACCLVAKLVPEKGGIWKAWVVFTMMEDLKGYEADLSMLDHTAPSLDDNVDALVIGAGPSGLQIAAALRTLGIECLVIEQYDCVGDNWRNHYDILKLHLSKWYCQLAYLPFPPDTPYYPSRDQVADFLEMYAKSLHLNIKTSTTVRHATYDRNAVNWNVNLVSKDGSVRDLRVGQLIIASGMFGLRPVMPKIKEQDHFRGTVLHSFQFKNGAIGKGKKVIVIGVGNSGHDIAQDLHDHGAMVTMIQRNPTMVNHQAVQAVTMSQMYDAGILVATADRIRASNPNAVDRLLAALPQKPLDPAFVAINEGLVKAGFRIQPVDRMLTYARAGGHYLNTGTSELIVSGKIGIKSGIPIDSYVSDGLQFADGTKVEADLVLFATGFDIEIVREVACQMIGSEEGKDLKQVWGFDEEGHVIGAFRNSGHPKLWYFTGDFQSARIYSKLTALQIKATQLGILKRYDESRA